MVRYVVGIITDESRVLLLKKSDPYWPRGLYDGIEGMVLEEDIPKNTLITKCKEKTGLDIYYWTELETTPLAESDSTLTYFLSTISKDEIEKAQSSLEYEKLELFDMKKLPSNIVFDFKHQIEEILLDKVRERRKKIKRVFSYIGYPFIAIFFLFLLLMIYGKVTKGNYLYLFEAKDELYFEVDETKRAKFKKGFIESILAY